MERPRFTDHLEAIKFICKDFWSEIFKKQIDNLKTNHRGTFVLQDHHFRWFSHIAAGPSNDNAEPSSDASESPTGNKAAQAASMCNTPFCKRGNVVAPVITRTLMSS